MMKKAQIEYYEGCNHRLDPEQLDHLRALRDVHGNAKFIPTAKERKYLAVLLAQDFLRDGTDGKVYVAREAFGNPPTRIINKGAAK